jgi:hypothetical protein
MNITQCPGCKIMLAATDYPADNRYGVSSAACRQAFDEILMQEGSQFGYPAVHRLIVDAYWAQHPPRHAIQQELGISERFIAASIQSISIHLIALYLALEKKVALKEIASHMDRILAHMSERGASFKELMPPEDLGSLRAADVRDMIQEPLTLDVYEKIAWAWSNAVWDAWKEHHAVIRSLYEMYG